MKRPRPISMLLLAAACLPVALWLCACGDTLQDQPTGVKSLEAVIVKSRFPVYWVGRRFQHMQITNVLIDPGGAVTIRYGDCLVGGQYTCVTPLTIVTSPDNSFVPGSATTAATGSIRGARVYASGHGATLSIPTGSVIVNVYAKNAALARAAAATMVPLNKLGIPGTPLPPAVSDTGIENMPLPSQVPPGYELPGS